jgi:hypothetical protein
VGRGQGLIKQLQKRGNRHQAIVKTAKGIEETPVSSIPFLHCLSID